MQFFSINLSRVISANTSMKRVLQSITILFSLYFGSSLEVFAASLTTDQAQEIFIKWRTDSLVKRTQIVQSFGLKKLWSSPVVSNLERFALAGDARSTGLLLHSLSQENSIVYAEPNYKMKRVIETPQNEITENFYYNILSFIIPNDPRFSEQWALTSEFGVHAVEAWNHSRGSRAVKVAIIDTGIDPSHPELSDRIVGGYDFIANSATLTDDHGHGTHVAGVIGAATQNGIGIAGINPEVSLIAIRAVPDNSDETDANVIAAFEFAAEQGAKVVNCSFGKAVSSQAVGDTIEALAAKDLLVVVAAGNDSEDNNVAPIFPANFRTSKMIVVASINSSGKLSYFSNYGMDKVDLAAPGSNILSTIPRERYASWSGTSMATPQVAGVAALTLSAHPELNVHQLKESLLKSAVEMEALKGKVNTGGRVDALAAVNAAHNLLINPENP